MIGYMLERSLAFGNRVRGHGMSVDSRAPPLGGPRGELLVSLSHGRLALADRTFDSQSLGRI